ncbi:MAG: hypothetical protein GY798_18565 [Hyphomicrobiales bacterium]|nr:hypothetical protein [Hyphomicrobiales bacterium]
MKVGLVAGLLLTSLPLTAALAQNSEPNLVGTWVYVEGDGITYKGKSEVKPEIEVIFDIEEQHGRVFKGTYSWSFPDTHGHLHDGTKHTNASTTGIVGVIGIDGTTLTIADHPDTGYHFGSMVDADTIEFVSVESGPQAVAAYGLLKRQE